ncbi:MAG: GDSL-type esterase/lipase family protein [Planctomycetota bacterium]
MKRLAFAYIVFLHFIIAGVIWNSDYADRIGRRLGFHCSSVKPEFTEYYDRLVRYHVRSVEAVPDDSVIFIGDSITQGLAVCAVHPFSVNYGIGGDTTQGVLERIPKYLPALRRAKSVVIAIGINDSRYRTVSSAIANYSKILDTLPQDRPVIVSAILSMDLPDSNEVASRLVWVDQFNSQLRKIAKQRISVTYIDTNAALDSNGDGLLDISLHDGDGLHLNSAGNLVWAENLRQALSDQNKLKQMGTREVAKHELAKDPADTLTR